jgi:hypothetical protein
MLIWPKQRENNLSLEKSGRLRYRTFLKLASSAGFVIQFRIFRLDRSPAFELDSHITPKPKDMIKTIAPNFEFTTTAFLVAR